MYTVFVVETVTGNTIGTLPCTIQAWADPLGSMPTATILLHPGTLTPASRDLYRLLTTPWRSSLVIDWDGTAVWGGPIVSRPFDGQTATINANGIKAVLNARKVHDWSMTSGHPSNTWTVTYTGVSLGQIAIDLVQLATSGTKPGAALPLVIPSGESDTDPTHVRTYNGYALANVGTELDNLTASLNGPDIHFLPQWTDSTRGHLQWVMRVGTKAQPSLYSPSPVVFDASSPKSSVQKITSTDDATGLTTTDWAAGAGATTGTLLSKYTSTTLTAELWPLLESETDYRTVSAQATLDAHTQADQQTHGTDVDQWTLTVNAQQAPVLGSFLLGDKAIIRTQGHVWIPDSTGQGWAKRIVSITGDNTPTVSLDVQ